MKNKLLSDFLREIRKSFGRFISIFFIVLLGTAFFSGLRSSGHDMKLSADAYYDDSSLMDIKLLGTLGFTEEELHYFKNVDGISELYPAHTKDALLDSQNSELLVRVIEYTDEINRPYLLEGRLPEKTDECLLDAKVYYQNHYKLGDRLSLKSGNSEDLGEDLLETSFTITGVGYLPYYLELGRGISRIGDGSVDAFLLVQKEVFKSDVYSEIYLKAENSDSLLTYSKEYEEKLRPVIRSLEALSDTVGKSRLDSIRSKANSEISDAESEVKKGEKELSDAKEKLEKGEKDLVDAKEKLKKEKQKLKDAEKKIADGNSKITAAKKELASGKKELDKGFQTLSEKKEKFQKEEESYQNGIASYEKGLKDYNEGLEHYLVGKKNYEDGLLQYAQNKELLDKAIAEYQTSFAGYEEAKKAGFSSPETEEKLNFTRVELEKKKLELEGAKATLDTTKTTLDTSQKELSSSKELLDSTGKKLDSGKKKLDEGAVSLHSAETLLMSKKSELEMAELKLEAEERLLNQAESELFSGRTKLAEGKDKLQKQEKKFQKSKKKYQKNLPKATADIKDAKQKIYDARKKILDLETPDFYVLGRDKMESYVSFEQNANRMDSIGNVFPVIFFLVASLVSLTAMTRMVDEGRINMGTLKALGFSNLRISAKYLAYSLLATVTGSLFGIALGERFLPLLIIKSYGTLFIGMPYVLTPPNYEQAILALLAAVLSTGGATLLSCLKELRESPASLMRPIPPKHGKRVLLERIPFLWKPLSFTRKATIRNLSRYKKRLIMTVIGIGGCMGLLLVGFGLRDSIQEIAKKQYVNIFTYDANLSLNTKANPEEISFLTEIINSSSEIEHTNYIYTQTLDLFHENNERQTILFVPKNTDSMEHFLVLRERGKKAVIPYPKTGAFLSEKTAAMLGVKVGDSVQIRKEGFEAQSVKVERIIENYVFHYIFLSKETFQSLYGYEPDYNSIFMSYVNPLSHEEEHKLGSKLLSLPACSGIRFVTELEEDIDKMLEVLNLVILVLISSAGLLAFVVLYNLNSINVMERKRELATLKVLGFYDSEVSAYIYRENILLTLFGILTGMVFGTILHLFVIKTVEIDLMMFGRKISLLSYLLSILITFFFSFLVNLVMHFSLKKIDMIESLKSVE